MKIIQFLQQRVYLFAVVTAVFSLLALAFLVFIPNSMMNNQTHDIQQNLVVLSENHISDPEIKEYYNLYIYKNGSSSLETHNGYIQNINEQLDERFINWGQLQSTPTKLYITQFEEQDFFFYVTVVEDEYYVVTYYKIEEITTRITSFKTFSAAIIIVLYVAVLVLSALGINMRFILDLAYYDPNTKLRTKYALITRFHKKRIAEYDLNYIIIENLNDVLKAVGHKDADELHVNIGETFEEIYMREGLYQISKNRFMALNDHKMDNTLIEDIFNQAIQERIGKNFYRLKLRILTINEELVSRMETEEVLKRFDFAYTYVRNTKDKTYFIDERMLEFYNDASYFKDNFEEALEKGWITNVYQAKYNPKTGIPVSCEALSRWDNGVRLISPRHYMSLAETTGLITEVDFHSFENACRLLQTLAHDGLLTEEFRVSVNFSTLTLKNLDINVLQKIIDDYAVLPTNITIELRKSVVNDIQEVTALLEDISNMGITLSLAKFNAGDPCLSVLPLLNISEICLDRDAMPNFEEAKEVMVYQSLITVAKKLKLKINAKGVTSKEQVDFLKAKVQSVQGEYYSKPLDKKRFLELFKK